MANKKDSKSKKGGPATDNSANNEATELPLSGIRVVELADGLGEMCGRMLADFGAEVIKVEPPEGASSRKMPPIVGKDEKDESAISCYFEFRNFNKKSVVLDLKSADGKNADDKNTTDIAKLKNLLASTDILIESFQPGQLKKLGLDPEDLQKEFPHLIITSVTPFGQTGPYSQYLATSDTLFSIGGWLAQSGIPDKPPITSPGYMAYDVAGIIGCFASLLAIIKRQRTGCGQHIDVSAAESLSQCGTWGLVNSSATIGAGMPPVRMRTGTSPLYALFPTADGMVRLVILNSKQWAAMYEWLGKPEEFSDPSWGETFQRIVNADVLNPYFTRLFADMKMEECAKEAQKRGIVVTPLLKPSDIIKNEHFVSRNTFVETEVGGSASSATKKAGKLAHKTGKLAPKIGKLARGWMEINSKQVGFRSPAPALGQHQDSVDEKREPVKFDLQPDDEPALDGLRVMDFGHGGVGVEGSKLLAEYGADVIKLETRTYFDFMRVVQMTEMTPSFASSSRSKRSLGVNPKDPQGQKIIHELAKISDLVIENNSTGTMKTLNVDYEALAKINPKITMASSQMMGSHGAYGDWIGYGPTISTVGGIDWLWGFDDGDPPPGTSHVHPDHMAGRICAIACLLGIINREKTGKGFHAEMAQVENLISTLGDIYLKESLEPNSISPQGNNFGGDFAGRDAAWGPFKCALDNENDTKPKNTKHVPEDAPLEENWCVICVQNDEQWQDLVELMGSPDWAKEEIFSTRESRIANQQKVIDGVTEWTKNLTSYEVMEKCQSANIPAGAMLFYDELITDSHYVARGFPLEKEQQGLGGKIFFEGASFKASNLPEPYFCQAPGLGEHTQEICKELLQMDESEIAKLIEAESLEVDTVTSVDGSEDAKVTW